jgi:hypothetical protein
MFGFQEDGNIILKLILKKLDGCRIETGGGLLCRGMNLRVPKKCKKFFE